MAAGAEYLSPSPAGTASLDALFNPRTVAVYGASAEPGSMGSRAVGHLISGGYEGEIVPINPRRADIDGRQCYPSAVSYGRPIDHAMIVVRARAVPGVVRDCVAAGVRSASILSGGFAESGADGRQIQDEIAQAIAGSDLRLLGPNCLGFADGTHHVCASPGSIFETLAVQADAPLAIVSQSGAIAGDVLARAAERGIAVNFWASTGNELDVCLADCLGMLAGRESVKVVALYVEGIHDVTEFVAAVRSLRTAGKAVVVVRSGRTNAGMAAVRSHTAALVTSSNLYDALFRQLGVVQTFGIRELVDAVQVISAVGSRPGPLAIVTSSGGSGALAADAAEAGHLRLAPISEQAQQSLRSIVPFCSPRNPIDITGMTNENPDVLLPFLSTILDESGVGLVVMIHGTGMLWVDRARWISRVLEQVTTRYGTDRLLFVGMLPPEVVEPIRATGLEVFPDAVDLIKTLSAISAASDSEPDDGESRPAGPPAVLTAPTFVLPEDRALDLVEGHGIPAVTRRVVTDEATLLADTDALGYPLVAKAVLRGVTHKTEIGAVRIGLTSPADVRDAWRSFAALAATRGEQPRVLLEHMVTDAAAELLLSAFIDPLLGPFVTVGTGGTATEIANDVVVAPSPLTRDRAEAMLRRLRIWPHLERSRGNIGGNVAEVVDVILAISALPGLTVDGSQVSPDLAGTALRVREVEINPFLVRATGSCCADAVILAEKDDR